VVAVAVVQDILAGQVVLETKQVVMVRHTLLEVAVATVVAVLTQVVKVEI
jgi:hypothetical protein